MRNADRPHDDDALTYVLFAALLLFMACGHGMGL